MHIADEISFDKMLTHLTSWCWFLFALTRPRSHIWVHRAFSLRECTRACTCVSCLQVLLGIKFPYLSSSELPSHCSRSILYKTFYSYFALWMFCINYVLHFHPIIIIIIKFLLYILEIYSYNMQYAIQHGRGCTYISDAHFKSILFVLTAACVACT